jgi:hypothetical protein
MSAQTPTKTKKTSKKAKAKIEEVKKEPVKVVTPPAEAYADIKFEEEDHDMGVIKEGESPVWNIKFTNTGTAPLILTNVQPGCGCTVPEWPKEPIAPGKSGIIKATYNSSGRGTGAVSKSLTVTSNAKEGNNNKVLSFHVDVKPAQ